MAPAKRATTTTTSGGASADDAADDVERANAANDEDDGGEDGADAGEEDGEELGEEDANRVRDARVPSVPRDAVVVREILKSMVRVRASCVYVCARRAVMGKAQWRAKRASLD